MSRLSQVLVVALVTVTGWLTLAGRPGRAEPETSDAQPGDAAAVAEAEAPQPPAIDRGVFAAQKREARREIEAKLHKRVTFTFKDEALRDVLAEFGRAGGFTVWIDARALGDEGIEDDEPINQVLSGVSIQTALSLLLEPRGMTSLIEDEVVQVTTQIAADEQLSTRVYNVGRLLELQPLDRGQAADEDLGDVAFRQFGSAPRPPAEGDWIIDTVQEFTSGPWDEIDGSGGTISLVRHLLVVRQTDHVQTEVERLLGVLELAADGQLEHGSMDVRPAGYPHAEDAAIHKALADRTTLDLRDRPLKSAMEEVARIGGFAVLLDNKALQDEGIAADEPITLHVADVSWHSALRLMLNPMGLTFVVEDGVLKITTGIAAEEKLVTVVHDIRDLSEARLDGWPLLQAVQESTSGPWMELDGTGGVVGQPVAGILIVRQTEEVLAEIAALLDDLRKQPRDRRPAAAAQPREPADADHADPVRAVTRFYAIDPLLAESAADLAALGASPAAPSDARHARRTALERAILTFVAPDTWREHGTGGRGALEKVNDLLVIRQTPGVHGELREFLTRLERAAGQTAAALGGEGTVGPKGGGFFDVPPAARTPPDP